MPSLEIRDLKGDLTSASGSAPGLESSGRQREAPIFMVWQVLDFQLWFSRFQQSRSGSLLFNIK